MGLRLDITTAREFRWYTYRMLRRIHDLEYGRKFQGICDRRREDDGRAYVILLLERLSSFMEDVLVREIEEDYKVLLGKLIGRLERLRDDVVMACEGTKPLNSDNLALALNAHTRVLRPLLENAVSLDISTDEWSQCVLLYIAIWGDDI